MNWGDFKDIVDEGLGIEAVRRGTEAMRLRAAREAVIDLQRYIRAYRQGHQTTYLLADVTELGEASFGVLPAGALPKAFYVYSTATDDDPIVDRNRLDIFEWSCRRAMEIGSLSPARYVYAIAPFGHSGSQAPQLVQRSASILYAIMHPIYSSLRR